jgi:hypothetical protein
VRAAVGSVEIWPLDSNNPSLYACLQGYPGSAQDHGRPRCKTSLAATAAEQNGTVRTCTLPFEQLIFRKTLGLAQCELPLSHLRLQVGLPGTQFARLN